MRLLTTNGMDVKEIKGHTNPSKRDVTRCPPELAGLYEFCQNFVLTNAVLTVGDVVIVTLKTTTHEGKRA
jgi:hypothetical protein